MSKARGHPPSPADSRTGAAARRAAAGRAVARFGVRRAGHVDRIGLDPILGLVPGLGDLVSPLFTIGILWQARELGIPRVVQLRMIFNVAIDTLVGVVPVARRPVRLRVEGQRHEHGAARAPRLRGARRLPRRLAVRRGRWSLLLVLIAVAAVRPARLADRRPLRSALLMPRVFLLSPANCGGIRAQDGHVGRRAVRAGAAAARRRRRAARRRLQLRQRPVLPRQARLRAPVRAAARSRPIRSPPAACS